MDAKLAAPDGSRLERRLAALRRQRDDTRVERHETAVRAADRAERAGEGDDDIRARIAAIVRAAEPARTEPVWRDAPATDAASLARRLAAAVDGDAVETERGWYVRRELRPTYLPIDRARLARLPGMPDPATPLLCLDTETTGLGSAAGTVAFLVGLARFDGDRLRLWQLFLPDLSEESALLDALAAHVPPGACLVTYNGLTFDWPLLETRYRLARRRPPELAAHLDLLLLVRRLFRHRLPDARLQTVERALLHRIRTPDIPSWEIPSIYHAFLRGGDAAPIRVVARHNAEDVVTLGRILAHLEQRYAAPEMWPAAPTGDLLRLARVFRRAAAVEQAAACFGEACERLAIAELESALAALELARLLRRAGRRDEARSVWERLAAAPAPLAALGWVELAKDAEHHRRDLAAAWQATEQALRAAATAESMPPGSSFQHDLAKRRRRLERRLAARSAEGR